MLILQSYKRRQQITSTGCCWLPDLDLNNLLSTTVSLYSVLCSEKHSYSLLSQAQCEDIQMWCDIWPLLLETLYSVKKWERTWPGRGWNPSQALALPFFWAIHADSLWLDFVPTLAQLPALVPLLSLTSMFYRLWIIFLWLDRGGLSGGYNCRCQKSWTKAKEQGDNWRV